MYINYEAALEMCNLKSFYEGGEYRCLKHPVNKKILLLNKFKHDSHDRRKEKFTVNFARGEALKMSTIPYLQRRLNRGLPD